MSLLSVNRNHPTRGRYVTELARSAAIMTEEFFGIIWPRVLRDDKKSEPSRARRWAAWWLYSQGLSLREIGRCMDRDHKAIQRMITRARWEDEHDLMNTKAICKLADGALAKLRLAEIEWAPEFAGGVNIHKLCREPYKPALRVIGDWRKGADHG